MTVTAAPDAPPSVAAGYGIKASASLLWTLSRKDVKLRYRRATLGVLWFVIQPAIQAGVLALVMSRVFVVGIENYPVFVLAGVLPWAMTTRSIASATTSVMDNASLIRKVAVPKALFPLSAVVATFLASLGSIVLLLVASAAIGGLGRNALLLIPAVALQFVLVAGVSFATSALQVQRRDVKFAVESAISVGFYMTPIIYPGGRLGEVGEKIIRFNPMTGVLDIYRGALGVGTIDMAAVSVSIAAAAIALVGGIVLFRRRSGNFADLL